MSFRNNLLSLILSSLLLLVGCGGGGSDFGVGNGSGDLGGGSENNDSDDESEEDEQDEESENTSTVSYLPLSVLEKFESYSGLIANDLFQGEAQDPLIPVHMIRPINASTLASVDNAVPSDFKVTVDDIEIDATESFPILQKVIGNPVILRTALVFDVTGSTNEVDLAALVNEVKSYITAAKAHTNPIIANQEFVIWYFGETNPALENVVDVTAGFTSDSAALNAGLDSLVLKPSAPSSLHKAIVKAIGRFNDDSVDPVIDFSADGDNDLYDRVTSNGILLSQMVVFSSGPDNLLEFTQAQMTEAIQSQGFLEFDIADPSATNNFTDKAVFYYVLGASAPGNTYQALSDLAEVTTSLMLEDDEYSFSEALISNQLSAIDRRIDLDNQYIYRYAFLPRQGDHTAIFSSRTEDFNYSLTTQYSSEYFSDNGFETRGVPAFELPSLVEITGPNGEYISAATASLDDVDTFNATTRWTSESYSPISDYTWTLTGGTGTLNADGSYTVGSISGATATLEVENTVRSETAEITITN